MLMQRIASEQGKNDHKILVANLEPDVTSERLLAAFQNFY